MQIGDLHFTLSTDGPRPVLHIGALHHGVHAPITTADLWRLSQWAHRKAQQLEDKET